MMKISATKNGSYTIQGPAEIIGTDGKILKTLKEGETEWLCRCGHSKNKPFCDRTHLEIGFEG